MKKEGKFKVHTITELEDFKEGMIIPESDLLLKNDKRVVQFEYIKPPKKAKTKYEAEPGIYNIEHKGNSIALVELELRNRKLLTSYDNTSLIIGEAKNFFDNLHLYEQLEIDEKKRAILLYSPPGYGKTSAISQTALDLCKEDPKTICINWPTSEVRSSDANRFLSKVDYETNGITRLVLIIEDLGGGEKEDHHGGERAIDSSLLNLLDGVDNTFPLPTFIIATTNHPGSLLDALADRPGRFDEYLELDPPNLQQRIELIEFISKRKTTDEEKAALEKAADFSPAHLAEVVKKSVLKGLTYDEAIDLMVNHKAKVSKRFEKNRTSKMGLGL